MPINGFPFVPDTDAALQLAIAYIWMTEGTYDKEYIKTHTFGYEKFAEYVLGKEDGSSQDPGMGFCQMRLFRNGLSKPWPGSGLLKLPPSLMAMADRVFAGLIHRECPSGSVAVSDAGPGQTGCVICQDDRMVAILQIRIRCRNCRSV